MEAYKVKKGTIVVVTDDSIKTPPASTPVNKGDIITINSIDGAYCNGVNENGDRIYIAACAEVEIVNN